MSNPIVFGDKFVPDVLEPMKQGLDWKAITREWNASVCSEAISEAIRLARRSLVDDNGRLNSHPHP
ncbi:MAG: hypothetical protein SFV51_20130 [Bryobacteraceae bacterium]|nr:hypothetical protein [Bryobacteraceae bacterium]